MAVIKALLYAGLFTLGLFVIITVIIWIIPILFFVGIFSGIALVAYVILKEDGKKQRPP